MTAPDPLVPADVDLTGTPFFPLQDERLKRSTAWLRARRNPEVGFFSINLWTASWREKPASSIENDDDVLMDRAMCSTAHWKRLREQILRGWVLCSDGRIYHPVVAEMALNVWIERLTARLKGGAGNAKRWGGQFDRALIERQIEVAKQAVAKLLCKSLNDPAAMPAPSPSDPTAIPAPSQGKVREVEGKHLSTPEVGSNSPPTDAAASASKFRLEKQSEGTPSSFTRIDTAWRKTRIGVLQTAKAMNFREQIPGEQWDGYVDQLASHVDQHMRNQQVEWARREAERRQEIEPVARQR
jgi:hypothetical protein